MRMAPMLIFFASVALAGASTCTENGCKECEKWHPGKAVECMGCGNKCWNICEKVMAANGGNRGECYAQDSEYLKCHLDCMTNHEYADPISSGQTVNCTDPVFVCPPPVNGYKVATDLIWALWNYVLVGYWAWMLFSKLPKNGNTYFGLCYCVLVTAAFEGTFFILKTVHNLNPSNALIVYQWGLSLQMFNGIAIWMLAFFLGRRGWQWTIKQCICRVAILFVIATFFATAIMYTMHNNPNIGGLQSIRPIFLVWFEPPQLIIIAFTIASAAHKGCDACNGFTIYFLGSITLWGTHIVSMAMQSRSAEAKEVFGFVYIPLQLLGSGVAAWGMTKILVDKEFERQDRTQVLQEAGINLNECTQEREEREKNGVVTKVASPEMLYSYGVVFVLLGYFGSTMCLLFITKPVMNDDPVFRLYGTLHPCILLDYLPGTLWAQPMFGAGILISQMSMLAALFRTAAYGDAVATLLQAMLFGWYWLVSAFFILVFTFNPSMTTVLLHSVPYMIMNIANAFFVITTIVIMFRWKGLKGKTITTMCGILYSMAIIYGTFFMSGKLMSHEGLNLLDKKTTDPKALEAVEDLEPDFDAGPMIITLIAQAMILSFGYMSPLRHRPLAFEVFSREANVPTNYVGTPNAEKAGEDQAAQHASFSEPVAGARNFRLQLRSRTPFIITTLLIGFMLFAAWEFDRRINPETSEHDYREIFRRQPGSAIVAVGWMIIANFLVAHIILAVAHEWYTNDNDAIKYWTAFAGLLLAICALLAHAGTIPNQDSTVWYKSTDWFKGVEAFMFALGIWLFTDALLCFQTLSRMLKADDVLADLADDDQDAEDGGFCQTHLKPFLMLEILLGVVGGVCLLLLGFRVPSKVVDGVALLAVILFAFCDARGVDVILATMRVATPTDLLKRDINGEWVLPGPVIDSIALPEYEFEYIDDDAEPVGKGYGGMTETDLLNSS